MTAFDFSLASVNEGPVEPTLIPGFGGTWVERVIDESSPGVWVDVAVGADGRREVIDWSGLDTREEARQWAMIESE